ncbi:DMT family transporter [Dyadobacter alkalitolerans]|uniref:DMT family transporter n=1 Tax=Dyadobacter alkalitolerans TaxID=492736 RepID=UPI00286DADD1|nr:multidrug efflux SMR transporter [Dyadobacter alkalitolerans]
MLRWLWSLSQIPKQEDDLPPYWEPNRDGPTYKGQSHVLDLFGFCGPFGGCLGYFMKQSDGFTRLIPTSITIIAMIASFGLLALAMRTLPLSTAYTVWTGIGAIGAFLIGTFLLGEPASTMRVVAALLITADLLIMKFS